MRGEYRLSKQIHMNTDNKNSVKIPFLDGLRGIAALMVFMAHLMIALYPGVVTFNPAEQHTRFDFELGLSPFSFFWRGNFAVCIFFVISGFVLSEFCKKAKISFAAQLVRRYLRLAIPMLITSIFAWLLLSFGLYHNDLASTVTHSGWLSSWYHFDANFLKMAREALYGAFVEGSASYNPNLWTMRIELLGSFYIFLLHALLKNRLLRVLAIIWMMKINHHRYYLLFYWGAFLFDAKDEIIASLRYVLPQYHLRMSVVAIGFVTGIYFGAFPEAPVGMKSVWYSWFTKSTDVQGWHMLGAMLLVMFLFEWHAAQHFLSNSLCRFLGKISFVLYLVHLPIICSVTSSLIYITKDLPYAVMAFISAGVSILFVITMSALTYRFIDQNTTVFSRWVGDLFDQWFSETIHIKGPLAVSTGKKTF